MAQQPPPSPHQSPRFDNPALKVIAPADESIYEAIDNYEALPASAFKPQEPPALPAPRGSQNVSAPTPDLTPDQIATESVHRRIAEALAPPPTAIVTKAVLEETPQPAEDVALRPTPAPRHKRALSMFDHRVMC